jgi:carboxypeptidase family protein
VMIQPQPPGPGPGGPNAPIVPQPPPIPGGQPPVQPLPTEPAWWADTPVTVASRDVPGVSVALHRAASISGRLQIDGAGPRPTSMQLGQIPLRVDSVEQPVPAGAAAMWRGVIDADGSFHTMGVPPGKYLLRVPTGGRGWSPRSAIAGGRDILDVPVDVGSTDVTGVILTISDRPLGTFSGHVQDAQGAPLADATVAVFPFDRTMWTDTTPQSRRMRVVRPAASGTYSIPGLPPGDYFIVAVAGGAAAEWQDPTRLEAWAARGNRVTLGDGEARTIDLRIRK